MFGWLRRLFRREPEIPADILRQLERDGPRRLHYAIAHKILPSLAFTNPGKFLAIMGETPNVHKLWNDVCQDLPPEDRLPADGLSAERREHNNYHFVLITFPTPRGTTEAYFTAFVVGPVDRDALQKEVDASGRDFIAASMEAFQKLPNYYFTLENGIHAADGSPRTVFCGWTKDETHYNMGDGPAAELSAFYLFLCEHLKKKKAA